VERRVRGLTIIVIYMHRNCTPVQVRSLFFTVLALLYVGKSSDVNLRVIYKGLWADDSEAGTVTKEASLTFFLRFHLSGTKEDPKNL
jgi:hypothetical protein